MDPIALVRQQTRAQHLRVERLVPLALTPLTLPYYRQLLATFLGIFQPLESILSNLPVPADLQLAGRQRSHLLVLDLQRLGLAPDAIHALPRCADLPRPATLPQILGLMYVTEGSTLGGQYISRLVLQHLALDETSGCAFFSSHRAEVLPMWQRFCAIVRAEVADDLTQQEFVSSALSTFLAFEHWIERSLPLSSPE